MGDLVASEHQVVRLRIFVDVDVLRDLENKRCIRSITSDLHLTGMEGFIWLFINDLE